MGKEAKQSKKQKLGFLSSDLHAQEQACMHIIKLAYTGKIMHMQVLARKP